MIPVGDVPSSANGLAPGASRARPERGEVMLLRTIANDVGLNKNWVLNSDRKHQLRVRVRLRLRVRVRDGDCGGSFIAHSD